MESQEVDRFQWWCHILTVFKAVEVSKLKGDLSRSALKGLRKQEKS